MCEPGGSTVALLQVLHIIIFRLEMFGPILSISRGVRPISPSPGVKSGSVFTSVRPISPHFAPTLFCNFSQIPEKILASSRARGGIKIRRGPSRAPEAPSR